MKVLLSIKPVFAEKIFEGSKKFEFRRLVFKNKEVSKIVVYASAPISKVIGEFEVAKIIKEDLDTLWSETKEHSGMSKDYFDKYFSGKKKGYAIVVENPVKYNIALNLKESFDMVPPQSFAYLR